MFLKKKRRKRKKGKEGRKREGNKRKIKPSPTDSEWPYMKTSGKLSDLAVILLGTIIIIATVHRVLPCSRHCAK